MQLALLCNLTVHSVTVRAQHYQWQLRQQLFWLSLLSVQKRCLLAKPRLFTSHPPHGCTPQRAPRGKREEGQGEGDCAQAIAA